jgi:hypothetical protein
VILSVGVWRLYGEPTRTCKVSQTKGGGESDAYAPLPPSEGEPVAVLVVEPT